MCAGGLAARGRSIEQWVGLEPWQGRPVRGVGILRRVARGRPHIRPLLSLKSDAARAGGRAVFSAFILQGKFSAYGSMRDQIIAAICSLWCSPYYVCIMLAARCPYRKDSRRIFGHL
jgi:hypothetical protein